MKNLNIPVGISDFERIRELNYYYVDKTGLIKTLLQGEMDQVTLITRPRRFGKTMAMNMLNSFLDIRKDSRHLFKGLEISDEVEICEKWMNQYPTLFLSFKDVDGTTFENAFNFLKFIISEACKQHVYLLVTGEPLENGQISEKNLPPDGRNAISAARNWYLFELSDDDRKVFPRPRRGAGPDLDRVPAG